MPSTRSVRAWLALMVIGVFMTITGFMAIYPLVTPVKVSLNDYADFFAKTASVYTGIIGVIIGFYFGRHMDEQPIQRGHGARTLLDQRGTPQKEESSPSVTDQLG